MAEQAIVYLQKILEATDKKGARSAAGQQKSSTLPGDKPRDQGRETSNSRAQAQHAGMNSSSHNGYNHTNEHSTIPPAKRHCNSAHTMLPVATATTGSAVSQCLECEVKDAEIHTLRRRIQLLKEQVANTNTPPQSHAGVPIQVRPTYALLLVVKENYLFFVLLVPIFYPLTSYSVDHHCSLQLPLAVCDVT